MAGSPHPTGRFGGIRALERRLRGRCDVIEQNKEGVAQALLDLASAKLTDVIEWDAEGNVKVRPSADIPDNVAAAIKKVRVSRNKDGDPTLELEMHDKISVLRILAKSAGLLEPPDRGPDTPSVIGIKIVGPEVVTTTYEEVEGDGTP
jgi:hypothetical protein